MPWYERWSDLRVAPASLALLFLVGCDTTPTVPDPAGFDEEVASLVESEWAALVDRGALGLETLTALGAAPDADGAAHLAEAGLLEAEMEHLDRTGAPEAARALETAAELHWIEAAVLTLGARTVDRVVGGAESVAARIAAADGGRGNARLARADVHLERARAARAGGRSAEAVLHGTRAAEEIRGLSPEAHARSVVATALEFLARARSMAGDDPGDAIAAALARAESHCRNARTALDLEEWRRAVEEGRACGRLARAVIVRLAGGTPDDAVAERAEQAVAMARGYLERAVEVVGDDPRPPVAEALAEARALLREAARALEAGAYRDAVRAAHESAAISRRIVAAFGPGGSGGDDRPDGMEERAQAALDLASAVLERAKAMAGSDPSDEIRAALARASSLLDEAQEAYRAGRYRLAIARAHDALALARRVIQALETDRR